MMWKSRQSEIRSWSKQNWSNLNRVHKQLIYWHLATGPVWVSNAALKTDCSFILWNHVSGTCLPSPLASWTTLTRGQPSTHTQPPKLYMWPWPLAPSASLTRLSQLPSHIIQLYKKDVPEHVWDHHRNKLPSYSRIHFMVFLSKPLSWNNFYST